MTTTGCSNHKCFAAHLYKTQISTLSVTFTGFYLYQCTLP